MDQTIMTLAGSIIVLGGAAGIIWKVILPLVRKSKLLLDALDRFTRDWFGSDAEPGRDAVPGVMERLNNIDGELKHNGGSTMKDAIRRVERQLTRIEERIERGDARFLEGNSRFEKIESELEQLKKRS
jgi:hypothetical protein